MTSSGSGIPAQPSPRAPSRPCPITLNTHTHIHTHTHKTSKKRERRKCVVHSLSLSLGLGDQPSISLSRQPLASFGFILILRPLFHSSFNTHTHASAATQTHGREIGKRKREDGRGDERVRADAAAGRRHQQPPVCALGLAAARLLLGLCASAHSAREREGREIWGKRKERMRGSFRGGSVRQERGVR